MRIMVASDLHGSAHWTSMLLDRMRDENPDFLLLLGDLLYHGPRNALPKGYDPAETARLLNAVKGDLMCVKGNCDSEVDQCVLDFPIMAESALVSDGNRWMFATHGDKFNKDNPPPLRPGCALLNGHFHVPGISLISTGRNPCLNPGSVSIPKGGSPRSYAVIEDGCARIISLESGAVIAFKDDWIT